jgi:uncharacterized protein
VQLALQAPGTPCRINNETSVIRACSRHVNAGFRVKPLYHLRHAHPSARIRHPQNPSIMTVDWSAFTPWSAAVGGVVIGLAAALLVLVNGRVAGISGIIGGMLRPRTGEFGWRLAFTAGLLLAPLAYAMAGPRPSITIDAGYPILIVAGLLVGIGTRYAGGCTSGHGVCGLSRLSPRSLVATLSFMAAGFATVYVVRHLIGA